MKKMMDLKIYLMHFNTWILLLEIISDNSFKYSISETIFELDISLNSQEHIAVIEVKLIPLTVQPLSHKVIFG